MIDECRVSFNADIYSTPQVQGLWQASSPVSPVPYPKGTYTAHYSSFLKTS
ncbi:MAG: hypothetical protein RMI51_04040 [Aquificaceae bacterium]|nr:hypothetical protein [Aquificaceae bacterium]